MITVHNLLNELFDQPVKWYWQNGRPTPNTISHTFKADFSVQMRGVSVGYQMVFIPYKPYRGAPLMTYFYTVFRLKTETLPKELRTTNGTMDEFQLLRNAPHANIVLGTVIDILKAFLEAMHPISVSFTADEYEPSRQKLYARLVRMVQGRIPEYTGMAVSAKAFLIVRQDADPEIVATIKNYLVPQPAFNTTTNLMTELFDKPEAWRWLPANDPHNTAYTAHTRRDNFCATFTIVDVRGEKHPYYVRFFTQSSDEMKNRRGVCI